MSGGTQQQSLFTVPSPSIIMRGTARTLGSFEEGLNGDAEYDGVTQLRHKGPYSVVIRALAQHHHAWHC